ncbi:uncharacterized protein M6B38_280785 [Iris pallida]|uniref:Uncharacterized protein n=1 Tax=Iris pallida TaxID=29817 RepID=A0AAX6HZF0_IRIPA|nr:uncharacterized protein M6B38_280785 [Iris pallida]
MVLGRDGKGYVHGMGQGVSKTEIRASAASREIARREKQKNDAMLNRIENLEETVASLQTVGSNTSRSSQSSSQFHAPSPSEGHDHSTLPIKTCLLKNFRKKAVAIGRVNTDAPCNDEAYNIIVDDVFYGNEMLFDRDGKFDDITVGEMINWPKYSVQFVRF